MELVYVSRMLLYRVQKQDYTPRSETECGRDTPEEYDFKKRDLQDSYNPHHLTKLDSITQYNNNGEQVEE